MKRAIIWAVKSASEVLLYLLVDLALIITAARTLGALARRVGQPAVIGEIVAGILLGPTLLGAVAPGLPAKLFPPEVPLRQIADLGLVFFMFLVGLELDGNLIRKQGRRALSISLGGVIAPFVLGVLIAGPLLALNNAGQFVAGASRAPTALAFGLFMGAAMCITAFPVLARILVERGLYRSPLGTAALCAAAVDDVIAWVLLAAVVGLTRTGSPAEAARALGLSAVFATLMLTVGRRALAILARRYEATSRVTVDQVALVVVGLLLSASITEWIGIHSIFGAFLFGTIMPRGGRMTHELTDKIEDFTVVVLLPVFFAVAGLRTNMFSLDSAALAGWTVVITLAAIAGKMAGCGVAARLNGFSRRDSFVLGTLMNTRGLTELVILSVGLNLGVLSDRTFAMMVIMALVTTFMAAPLINRLMPRREMVRVLSGGDPEPVATRVLVALGNPLNAATLVDTGVRLAGANRPAEIMLVHLVPTARAPEFRTGLRNEEMDVDLSVDMMNSLASKVSDGGVRARSVSFLSDNVGRDLADIAATQRCTTIVLGWYRASMEPAALRAMVHRIFEHAPPPCDVAVLVDERGTGIVGDPGRAIVAAVAPNESAGVLDIAERLADGFNVGVLPIAPESPGFADTARSASAVVVGVDRVVRDDSNFGASVDALVRDAGGPVLVVRPKGATVTIRPATISGRIRASLSHKLTADSS
ncbi:MAG TPA: cation:proton antiporter [Gemmatimonadaceae bacterium]|nr:cation:proton antiporter [Gemmatimonadaceae bacterium]